MDPDVKKRKKITKGLKKMTASKVQLNCEISKTITSHKKNGKLLRDLHDQKS